MTTPTNTLLQELSAQTARLLSFAEAVSNLDDKALQQRPNAQSWSILECLEHLNLYGDFYLPAVRKAIAGAPSSKTETFKSGWLGTYFVKSMEPAGKKMKTFKDKDPLNAALNRSVITRFADQHNQWLKLLKAAEKVNLNHTKVPISIAPWLKLRLGDIFLFVFAHEARHQAQMEQLLAQVNAPKDFPVMEVV